MNPWVLLPVKPFSEAKSRLASVLSEAQRQALARMLWIRTFAAIRESVFFPRILVISREAEVLEQAKRYHVETMREADGLDLNRILQDAAQKATAWGALSLLVVPVDLPLLTTTCLESLANRLPTSDPAAAIVPDRHGTGTNVLFLAPPLLFPFQFGPSSSIRHQSASKAAGIEMQVLVDEALGLDLDLPEDLALLPENFMKSGGLEANI
jgi:2-phospho-L-lactate guanylyltransferase